jgi:hypothetical protein
VAEQRKEDCFRYLLPFERSIARSRQSWALQRSPDTVAAARALGYLATVFIWSLLGVIVGAVGVAIIVLFPGKAYGALVFSVIIVPFAMAWIRIGQSRRARREKT